MKYGPERRTQSVEQAVEKTKKFIVECFLRHDFNTDTRYYTGVAHLGIVFEVRSKLIEANPELRDRLLINQCGMRRAFTGTRLNKPPVRFGLDDGGEHLPHGDPLHAPRRRAQRGRKVAQQRDGD